LVQNGVSIETLFMRSSLLFIFLGWLVISCGKESTPPALVGNWKWTIQYAGNPSYNTTPQNTGIQEILSFRDDGSYSLSQNDTVVNFGKYKLSTVKSSGGQNVSRVQYTNTRVTDSTAYYLLANNNDSLFFSNDLIGTVGSGSRHYGRQ